MKTKSHITTNFRFLLFIILLGKQNSLNNKNSNRKYSYNSQITSEGGCGILSSLSAWPNFFWADLPLVFFLSSEIMVFARLCEALACILYISVFARCCCMPVVVFQIFFIFGHTDFTAGDGVDRDHIEPLMEIVELIIDRGGRERRQ